MVMGVSLFTSRVILKALGVNDFGIYNVVGGMVALFSVISGSLASSISRFITYELGTGDIEKLKKIFSTSIIVQFLISGFIIIIASPIAFWFLNYKMDIEPSRMMASNWVLLFSILTFIIGLLSVPYNACIIAHERMKAFAYVGLVEVLLKLGVAYIIYLFQNDRLIFYSFLLFVVSLIIRIVYGVYCTKNFQECHIKIQFCKSIFKEISSFAGWTVIGSSSSILQGQGTNIILNLFFGTAINAAYGIGTQVNTAVLNLSQNFMTALNPQITKSYAKKEHQNLMKLIFRGSRLSFILMWIMSIIIFFNTPFVLKLWLGIVPNYTVGFVRLFLIYSLIECISQPLITAQSATGIIKTYQICIGGIRFAVLPIIYIFFYLGFNPLFSMTVIIFMSIFLLILRLIFLKKFINLNISQFSIKVLARIIILIISSLIFSYMSIPKMEENLGSFILNSIIIFLITITNIFFIGLTNSERNLIFQKILLIFSKNYGLNK